MTQILPALEGFDFGMFWDSKTHRMTGSRPNLTMRLLLFSTQIPALKTKHVLHLEPLTKFLLGAARATLAATRHVLGFLAANRDL